MIIQNFHIFVRKCIHILLCQLFIDALKAISKSQPGQEQSLDICAAESFSLRDEPILMAKFYSLSPPGTRQHATRDCAHNIVSRRNTVVVLLLSALCTLTIRPYVFSEMRFAQLNERLHLDGTYGNRQQVSAGNVVVVLWSNRVLCGLF